MYGAACAASQHRKDSDAERRALDALYGRAPAAKAPAPQKTGVDALYSFDAPKTRGDPAGEQPKKHQHPKKR
eukprot:m51a1_g6148 hypothetical protein (72) ;mRNA; f:293095-293364